jgi:hypothetical protein
MEAGDKTSADLAAELTYSLARLSGLAVSCRSEPAASTGALAEPRRWRSTFDRYP